MLVVHSNPLVEPGSGDAGGMTVYVREMARALASRGTEIDIFTRWSEGSCRCETELFPGVNVVEVEAGPPDLQKENLPAHLPAFTAEVAHWAEARGRSYDLLHSHYWLSGRAAGLLSDRWGVPFVHTFHTLGRVKNDKLRSGDVAEPEVRLWGETKVIAEADAIVASTPEEWDWLIDLYAAHPERIHLIPPGVDHLRFSPDSQDSVRARMGLEGKKVLLFVGRLQPLKGPDTAIRAAAHLVEWGRIAREDLRLLIVGGGSGSFGATYPSRLEALGAELGISECLQFVTAKPHSQLPDFYRVADVCLVPSHTESFGLVALEAQACGVPVVASSVGGLRSIVHHGKTGYLVEAHSSEAFAERAWRILSDPPLASAMERLAVCSSGDFSWEKSADELREIYQSRLSSESITA